MRTTTGRNVRDGRSGRGGAGRENKKHNTSKHSKHVRNRKNIKNGDDIENRDDTDETADDEESVKKHSIWVHLIWGRGRACHSPPRALIRDFDDGRYYEAAGEIYCIRCGEYVCRLEELSENCRKTLGKWSDDYWRGE
jgi:hypothetical protein